MKAWQFTNTHAPLVLAEVHEPTPAKGEVLIDIRAAGLCHSDVGLMEDEGWLTMLGKRPITIGHEIAGVISALGEGVTGWRIGDRVGVNPASRTSPGYQRDGGYSFQSTALQEDLVRIPDTVSFEQGAIGTDAGMTSYHAVKVTGEVEAGDRVGIIGFGGLGQIGTRVAVLAGAEVHVAEINEAVWPLARAAGAKSVVRDVREFAGLRLDVIVDFAGFGSTTAGAVDVIRRGGTVVVVGMGALKSTIDTKSLILNQCRLLGSGGGTNDDIAGVYRLYESGDLTPVITTIGFDEIPAGLERLRVGGVTGRLVATMSE
jgi:propanol-preferring alcohol dehydrogenase